MRYFNKQQLSPQNPVFINPNFDASETQRTRNHNSTGCSALRKQSTPTEASAYKRGSRGNPLGVFDPLAPKRGPQPGGCQSGEDHP